MMELWAATVMAHALEHYNDDGWDMVVECMSPAEVLEELKKGFFDGRPVTSEAEAIERIAEICKLWNDRRTDIQATAW